MSSTLQTEESGGHRAVWTVHPTSSQTSLRDAPLATAFTEGHVHTVRHANAAFCALTGLDKHAIYNHALHGLFAADDQLVLQRLFDRVLETGMPNVVSDVAWHADGGIGPVRYLTAIASPVLSESTGEHGLLVQVLDTTEQVLARISEERIARESALANEALVLLGLREHERAESARREQERWNALVENSADGITILDRHGHPTLVNSVGRDLLHMDREPLDNYLARVFCTTAGIEIAHDRHPGRRALAGESFCDEELLLQRADGKCCRLVFSGSGVRDENGDVVLAINVFRDVTALRQLEEQREEYVALISHDLRSPLHSLLLSSQLLAARLEAAEAAALAIERKYAHSIERVTRRLAAMVDELYESSQLEASSMVMHLEPASPASLLLDVLDDVEEATEKGRISVASSTHDLPLVDVDPVKIQRALVNLVTNALKYSDAEVTIELAVVGPEVVFAVRDHGAGIAAGDLPFVFEKYHRARVTRDRDGMGLGLFIARRIVEAHGGRISVESIPGEGSTFRIALPSAPPRGT